MITWDCTEGHWKHQKGMTVEHWREARKDELVPIVGKHKLLLETLNERYAYTPLREPVDRFFGKRIAQSIESLPVKLRIVVLLRDVEELRYKEIAETLACPKGTVCSRLHRGRKIVQQRLQYYSGDDGSLPGTFDGLESLQKKMYP